MLDDNFCSFLEYTLTKAFPYAGNEIIKHFWCDGIALPHSENEYSKKTVHDKGEVILKAYAGKTGQEEYELVMKFGRKALSQYSRNLDIKNCVPGHEDNNWYSVDLTNKRIIIELL